MYCTKRLQVYTRIRWLRNKIIIFTANKIDVKMDWKVLNDVAVLEEIISRSASRPQVIFKHSIRCSISSVAKGRLDRSDSPSDVDFYYLDLVNNREISNKIAEIFMIDHESPQVLVIRNGECVYDESHMGINMQEILAVAV